MGELRKLDVTLSQELITDMDQAIQTGDYSNRDDVIDDAMKLWRRRREAEHARIHALIQEGLDSGPPLEGPFDLEDIRRRGMDRLRREGRI
ncbi:type II toxin-antitoxin system ParD family antitoxin [Sphingomonas sp. ID1715]|uniref:ribbon-helix-helix domain-containing protein n=1 Tax=Sphingomonas sp. ID1715 TaxID=1656898 RepID=UPI001487649C|nr:type II toxin-antitoxin system ParD family antitoxin [Sphingomonas sp. ID1715]NNM78289.1 type II toxin-antitoxin system ParD family antitoxin [Sphingomonas sp. ID1715]